MPDYSDELGGDIPFSECACGQTFQIMPRMKAYRCQCGVVTECAAISDERYEAMLGMPHSNVFGEDWQNRYPTA